MRARGARWLAGAAAAALAACALPAVAGAADYCVAPNQSCDAGHNVLTFEDALDQADDATDADRIILGSGTYTAPTAIGFDYLNANAPVEIVGQGTGQTILTSPAGGDFWVLRLVGGAGSSIHDLTVRLPQNASDGFSGLHTRNAARRIQVIEVPTQINNFRTGVNLVTGGTLEDSSVTLNGEHSTDAVQLVTPDVAVRRSALNARVAAESYGGTIERSRLTGAYLGIFAHRNLTTISGSLIRGTGTNANIIFAEPSPGASTTVNANGVTLVGPGLPNTYGAAVGDETSINDSVSVNLTNAIIRGVSTPMFAAASGGPGQMKIAASYSDYDPSSNSTYGSNASIVETNVSNVGDARFVDPASGDYRLLPGSPLIDIGDPATPQGLDIDGNPLVADGNSDGSARRDLGAFEFQPAPAQPAGPAPADRQRPLVSDFRATPSVFAVARAATPAAARLPRRTRFRYTLSEAVRVKLTIKRRLAGRPARYRTVGTLRRTGVKGANRIRFRGRIGKRSLRPGRYRAVISATDDAGNRSTLRRTRFRVASS